MNVSYLALPLIVCIIALLLLAIVLAKGRRRPAGRVFSFILFMLALYGLFTFFMRNSPDVEHALIWDRVVSTFGTGMFVLYYHFSLKLTDTKHWKISLMLSYVLWIIGTAISPTGLIIKDMTIKSYGYAPIVGPGVYIMYPFVFVLGISFYHLFKSARQSRDYEEKNRLQWVAAAMSFSLLGVALEAFPAIVPTALLGHLFFCLLAGIAILKYHLFDIRIIARKGLTYLLISALVAIPYVSIITIATWALGGKQVPLWVSLTLLVTLAFTAHPLWQWGQRLVDKLFYGKRYSSLNALERFSRECTGIIDLNSLSNHLISLTLPAMGASSAHLLMPRGNDMNFSLPESSAIEKNTDMYLDQNSILVRWLEKHDSPLRRSDIDYNSTLEAVTSKERALLNMINADLLVPFKYRDRLNGILTLSPKLSTEEYTKDDFDTLMVLARQASTAIENARLYAQSQEMAIKDGITGFYNHSFFQERTREEVEQAKTFKIPLSLVMINIDLFHIYNEIHGHAEGDKALADMAKVIRSISRETDLLFRYSGDEFAMLAPRTESSEASALAEKMRKAIESHHFPGLISGKGVLTISIGISCYPEHVADAETLAFCAELALLESKRKGRNAVSVYTPVASTVTSAAVISKASQLSYVSTILTLAAALDAKDPYTYGHSQKVAKYAVLLGEAIGIEPERLSALKTAALLHDIGKIGVPDHLLLKPQRFNDEERKEIQKHSTLAASILKHIPSLSNLLPHIVHHHERFDGTGYPDGIKGEDISIEARILAIADSYDAMTSLRPYRPALKTQDAIAEIRQCAGTQFDPNLVKVFCEVLGQNGLVMRTTEQIV
jgi:diguanylate cyclase (GGDEF)-like protein/putative nucleotidyltransferase with HDIG domain